MGDDLNTKIKQLTDILGQENMAENVKSLLSLLAGSVSRQDNDQKQPEASLLRDNKLENGGKRHENSVQGHSSNSAQGYSSNSAQGHSGNSVQGYGNSSMQEHDGSGMQGYDNNLYTNENNNFGHEGNKQTFMKNESIDNLEMLSKIKKVVDRIGSVNDPGINLLNAIRPFLNKSRQKKLNTCIQIMHVSKLARFMDDNEKSSN